MRLIYGIKTDTRKLGTEKTEKKLKFF